MAPPQGEQRCHGTCNVGRQPTLTEAQAWEIAGRPATQTESCHHQPPSRIAFPSILSSAQLQQIAPFIHDAVRALQMTDSGFDDINLDVSREAREAFRASATSWELTHSAILLPLGGTPPKFAGTPIVDDSSTVVAYLSTARSIAGVHILDLLDLDGNILHYDMQEDPIESDVLGNELVATLFTLGASLVVRSLARAVLARAAATALGKTVTKIVVVSARGISVEAERAVLLFLRSRRAQSIAASLARRGLKVIVNIGGEGAPGELAEFGEHIALNHQVRMGIAKRFVPNLVKEPGENIARVFERETVDKVVSRKVDFTFDPDEVAQGAFKVLKPGGQLNMGVFPKPGFGVRFEKALQDAGFKSVTNKSGGAFFTAVK
jgi:hypothetical protein